MHKQLLITFDYELFLGKRSGSVDACMITPSSKLMEILGKYGVKAVFFIDTVYLIRLKELSEHNRDCYDDFQKISAQLCDMVEKRHFVFPHIHPHWIDAVYLSETNEWNLSNNEKYRFTNISEAEKRIVFDNSIHLLKSIIHPKFPDYQINAHRAGGWCIQPFDDFKPFYEKHQIIYDFSVISGFFQFTDAQFFDFSNAPSKSVYRFKSDVCSENNDGQFVQFNISSIEIPLFLQWLNKIWLKIQYKLLKDHSFDRGAGQQAKVLPGFQPADKSGQNLENTSYERVSVDFMTGVKLNKYLSYFENNDYMHFISHPKMITSHNLTIFDKFLEKVFEKYSVETDFHLMIP